MDFFSKVWDKTIFGDNPIDPMFKSPPKAETPISSKVQAKEGTRKMLERYNDGYVALERSAADQANKNQTRFLANRSNVDTMAAAGKLPITPRNLAMVSAGIAAAGTQGKIGAVSGAQDIQDKQRIMVANTGIGKIKDSAGILGDVSTMQSMRGLSKLQDSVMVDNARTSALFDAARGGVQGWAMSDAFKEDWTNKYGTDANGNPIPFNPTMSQRAKWLFSGGM